MKALACFGLNRTFSVNQLILLTGLYFVAVFNFTFVSGAFNAIVSLETYNLLFLISVPLLLLALLVLLFSLFLLPGAKFLAKPVLITLMLLSSLVFYAGMTYGVVFDYGMIQNAFETHTVEAFSYVNAYMLMFLLVFAGLPLFWLVKVKVNYLSWCKETGQRLKLVVLSISAVAIIAYVFYPNYAAVGRNNSALKKQLIPFQYLSSGYKYIDRNYLSEPLEFKVLDDNLVQIPALAQEKNVLVMVVGETARAKSFAYNGYEKNTNPHTEHLQLLSFANMHACGTATAVSVPCMFSALPRQEFSKRKALSQQNLLDLARLAGVDVLWLDNNSGCQGVCKRINNERIKPDESHDLCDGDYCFDEVLLEPLAEKLGRLEQQTTLIVLHMIGSHGPTYYRRYPKEHALFLPDCQRSDIQNCSERALVNTYDNTIAYTDFVLAQIIERLTLLPGEINASLLYVSDHGESLGENGSYLHGFPYALAPKEQKHIPMLWWQADKPGLAEQNCRQQLSGQAYDHDNIFHSMLGLLSIESSTYNPEQDIFAACRSNSR
ncbi:phosphoethanolamine--lipid A transferase [Thalassomonas viridans]|uniref:Phosphoethanolamine--lipid A transferase n=1 Tax=Thalassomonas viridans TaxID=137584 RepID=A0AAE9Z4W7_9GAMM|nr:phosphoethanolamine--lipid A transferase [Thalassomonas viridans]WDE06816.1 phosphoethanolamine--lipid A transferase [Thalassomonas viridans]